MRQHQKNFEAIEEEVKYVMNTLQPQLEKDKDCVIMVTHVLSHPDWINIDCFQKRPSFSCLSKDNRPRKREWDFYKEWFYKCGSGYV